MFTVIKAGIHTTIQDSGRFMGAHLGIPVSGPMDRRSANNANLMLENKLDDALLECTFNGPSLQFHAPTLLSFTGAKTEIFKNDVSVDEKQIVRIQANDVISIGKFTKGCRLYIGIKGGVQSKQVYKSKSTCFTAGILRPLIKGDQCKYKSYKLNPKIQIAIQRPLGNCKLSVTKGPEFHLMHPKQKDQLLSSFFTILPTSNRMAYRLNHALHLKHHHTILSSGTLPGTVQWLPTGDIIILMRDCQTTGGYPRVLQLTEQSICDLSQLSPRQRFSIVLQ